MNPARKGEKPEANNDSCSHRQAPATSRNPLLPRTAGRRNPHGMEQPHGARSLWNTTTGTAPTVRRSARGPIDTTRCQPATVPYSPPRCRRHRLRRWQQSLQVRPRSHIRSSRWHCWPSSSHTANQPATPWGAAGSEAVRTCSQQATPQPPTIEEFCRGPCRLDACPWRERVRGGRQQRWGFFLELSNGDWGLGGVESRWERRGRRGNRFAFCRFDRIVEIYAAALTE